MSSCIKEIRLWDEKIDGIIRNESKAPMVKIVFKYPCKYLVFSVESFEELLRLWIKGEKIKKDGAFTDAYWLQKLIIDAFKKEGIDFLVKETTKQKSLD